MTSVIVPASARDYAVCHNWRAMSTESPRERMIRSAVVLMREHGVEATSFSRVLSHSGAPRGSIYHHFPGGKAQLIEEATRYGGDLIAAGLATALEGDDPLAAVDASADFWYSLLRQTDFAAGCPIVAATLEGDQVARDTAGQVFARWEGLIAEGLERHGVDGDRARSLGTLTVSAIEGGAILARAQRSIDPLDRVFDELRGILSAALREAGELHGAGVG